MSVQNPTTPYISAAAAAAFPDYIKALDQQILSIESASASAGAYGGSRMYVQIGEAVLANENSFFDAFYNYVSGTNSQYQINIVETSDVLITYRNFYLNYAAAYGAKIPGLGDSISSAYANQINYFTALTAPWVVISSSAVSLNVGETAVLRFQLSENSTDFNLADISVSGGSVINFNGSGILYY